MLHQQVELVISAIVFVLIHCEIMLNANKLNKRLRIKKSNDKIIHLRWPELTVSQLNPAPHGTEINTHLPIIK